MKPVLLFAALLAALPNLAMTQSITPEDQAHIAAIERDLPPAVVIKGRPAPAIESLAERMAATRTPGVSIAFFEDGRIRWTRTYGLADVASRRPVTPATLFQAASVSKPVTAMAALRLVQEGQLDLDEDVNARLTAWKVPASPFTAERKATLRGLLSHTAGLTVHGFDGYGPGKALPDAVEILEGRPPANSPPVVSDARPGERWVYSGGGYVVAQLLMTETTGTAFPDLMRDLVLRPAHMASSTYAQPLPAALVAAAATGYLADGEPLPGGRNSYPELGPAGLWTTPSDLARFAITLQEAFAGQSQTILDTATARLMLTPQINNFGLGLFLSPPGEPAWFEHGGDNLGFHAEMFAFTGGRREGVAIMTNGEGGRVLIPEILRAVAKTYGWSHARTEVRDLALLSPAELAALTGVYEIPGVARLTVTSDGGKLYLSALPLGPAPLELLPQTPSRFFMLSNGVTVEFIKDATGVPGKLAISGQFGDFQATRAAP